MSSHIEKEVSPPFNGHFFKKYFNISKYNTMQLEAVFPSYTDAFGRVLLEHDSYTSINLPSN